MTRFFTNTAGQKTPRNLANATATAATVPVSITRNSVEPLKKATSSCRASRRSTYWPPARGSMAGESSA